MRARLDLIIVITWKCLDLDTFDTLLSIFYTGVRVGNTCISRMYDCTILIEIKYVDLVSLFVLSAQK